MKFNLTTFILQGINFILLSYILYRVLYRPLQKIMEKRKRLVIEDIDRAVRMKEDALKLKEKYEGLLKEIESFRKKEIERAIEESEEKGKKIIEEAAHAAAEEKQKAAAVIENERHEMMESLKKYAAESSAGLAARLLAPLADESLHAKLTGMMMKELEERPPYAMEKGGEPKAVIASAYRLGNSERESIESMLKEYLGPSVKIEHKTDPSLIAGTRLWLDGLVLDGSLSGQLSAFKDRVTEGLK